MELKKDPEGSRPGRLKGNDRARGGEQNAESSFNGDRVWAWEDEKVSEKDNYNGCMT